MTRLAKNELYFQRLMPIEEILDRVDQVSGDDVHRLANIIFQDEFLTLQMVGRLDEKDFPLLDLTLG
jgi:predicted Zn-dependent peptidase